MLVRHVGVALLFVVVSSISALLRAADSWPTTQFQAFVGTPYTGEMEQADIEKLDEDYRQVADSDMYEPFRQVMRIGGILSAKDQKEMQKASKQAKKKKKTRR